MKYSSYNVIVDNMPQNYLLYNTMTEALVELDEDSLRFYRECLTDENYRSDPRFDILVGRKYLIPDNYDERSFIRFANRKSSFSNQKLQIVIAPTMDCNYKCIYCFESHHKGIMDKKTRDEVLSFLKNELSEKNYKHLHVDWFGGEPLLAWNIIAELSRELIGFCGANSITYGASIISNGYLLTEDIISEMISFKIDHIQLTLDGEKCVHDSRRMLRGGAGTYDVTMSKIKLLKNFDIGVSVRVNTDRRNMNSYEKLVSVIAEIHPSAHVYPARMECFPETNGSNDSAELSCKEFAKEIQLPFILSEDEAPEMPSKFFSCQAERANSYAIDERGNLYKCWNQIGDLSASYGNVKTYPDKVDMQNLLMYMGHDILEDKECADCIVLPLCMGGCAYQRMYKHRKQCIVEKYCLDDVIKAVWNKSRSE